MEFALCFAVWYLVGAIGSILGCMGDLRSGKDVSIGDILSLALISALGFLTFAIGFSHYIETTKFLKRTVFKGKHK